MAEYLFSRVIPRADLGWSQVEVCATRLVWSASGGVAIVRSPASYGEDRPCVSFPTRVARRPPGVLHTLTVPRRTVPACGAFNRNPMHHNSKRATGFISAACKPGRNRNGKRHDVVMDAKQQRRWKELRPEERPALNVLAYEAGSTWLASRAEKHGFAIALGAF